MLIELPPLKMYPFSHKEREVMLFKVCLGKVKFINIVNFGIYIFSHIPTKTSHVPLQIFIAIELIK